MINEKSTRFCPIFPQFLPTQFIFLPLEFLFLPLKFRKRPTKSGENPTKSKNAQRTQRKTSEFLKKEWDSGEKTMDGFF